MTPPAKTVKYILMAFVAVSIGAAIYKALPCRSGGMAPAECATTAAAAPAPQEKAAVKPAAAAVIARASQTAGAKTAVVYYFYTNARCSSCKTLEAYTREAVASRLAAGYKDWKVEFRGVNIEEEANQRFVQDYQLESKAVVVQKFVGERALNWSRLDKVWLLLGDKAAFVDYVADETHKVLDSK